MDYLIKGLIQVFEKLGVDDISSFEVTATEAKVIFKYGGGKFGISHVIDSWCEEGDHQYRAIISWFEKEIIKFISADDIRGGLK